MFISEGTNYSKDIMGSNLRLRLTDRPHFHLQSKIEHVTKYQNRYVRKMLNGLSEDIPENTNIICDFITAEQNEINIKESTKEWKIKNLILLSRFLNNKSFKDKTKEDILDYLNNARKPESIDPLHKSIGTWNNRQILFLKFFRWLYNANEPDHKMRITPPCMQGVKRLPRQEKSPYKPSDLWTSEEHAIFLKFCPSKRDRAFHAMANDTSARPHELLNLKIKDIKFKITTNGIQYAEILVSGKTKTRTLPLITSIPYVKDWLLNHPTGENTDSWLFVSLSNNQIKNIGRKLSRDGLLKQYQEFYRGHCFRDLLGGDDSVAEADKSCIHIMLAKPWNLYVIRHSALTQKSKILKEHTLRDHADWSVTSKMPQVYIHYFGNESSNSLLEAYGILKPEENDGFKSNILKPKYCPNCNESNKPHARICIKCKMILIYDEYAEVLEKQKQKDNEIEEMKKQIDIMKEGQKELLELLKSPKELHDILKNED
jgi:integrase